MSERKIVFDLSKVNLEDLCSIGIYKIVNSINNHFYIGSTFRCFKERFKEHCRKYEMYKEGQDRNINPKLWAAYDKYGIENFYVEILEILDEQEHEYILQIEEYYILNLNPNYNIALYPTVGGKPNLNKKLSEKWKSKIGEKSKQYKHSEETLKKVTANNKNNAVKLKFTNTITDEELHFSSWVEAGKYFDVAPSSLQNAFKRSKRTQWREWKINKLSTQTKKIKVFVNDLEIEFKSFSECDKHFNVYRGHTSEVVNKRTKNLIANKYKYEVI